MYKQIKEQVLNFNVMIRKELFKKYNINESHNIWDNDIDSWISIEIFRLMHNGELPKKRDKSVNWITGFLDKIKQEPKWWTNIMVQRNDWGSLFLTAKRMVYKFSNELL